MKKYSKNKIILSLGVLTLLFFSCFLIFNANDVVDAGAVTSIILDEQFDNYQNITELDRKFIVPSDSDISLNAGSSLDTIVLKEGYYGTGFITKENVTCENKVVVDLDFVSLQSKPTSSGTGFITVCFGVLKNEEVSNSTNWLQRVLEPKVNSNSQCNEGLSCLQVRLLAESTGRYALTVCNEKGETFDNVVLKVNGNTSNISIWKGKYYLKYNNIEDVTNGIFLTNKILRVTYQKDGDLTISFVSGENETVLCTTVGTNTKFPQYSEGKVGFGVMETTLGGVNYEMNNITVSTIDNEDVVEDVANGILTEDGLDLSDYCLYTHSKTLEKGKFNTPDIKLCFGKNLNTNENVYVRKGIVLSKEITENNLRISFDMTIDDIVGDSIFELAYNLSRRTSKIQTEGSASIYFRKQSDKLYIGGNKYTQEKVNLFEEELSSNKFNITIEIDYSGLTRIYIDDEKLTEYVGLAPEKYMAFGVTGERVDNVNYVDIEIDNLYIVNKYYVRAENTNIQENFDSDDFNTNEFYASNLIYRNAGVGGVYVKDNQLVFHNVAGNSYFMTKYKYSNLEITFDIVDIRRTAVKDGNENLAYPACGMIGICIGQDLYTNVLRPYNMPCYCLTCSVDKNTWEVIPNSTYAVAMQYNSTWKKKSNVLTGNLDLFSSSNSDKTYSVKLSYIDGKAKLYLKSSVDNDYTLLLEEELVEDYTGYVGIFAEGTRDNNPAALYSCGDFIIDNISIQNTDIDPIICSTDRVSSKKEKPADFNYIPRDDDDEYLITDKEIKKK